MTVQTARACLMGAILAVAGCGADSGSSGDGEAPTLASLSVDPTTLEVGKATQINASVGFADADGDVAQVHVDVTLPDGTTQGLGDLAIQGAGGVTQGVAVVAILLQPPAAGDYVLSLYLIDQAGNESKTSEATVTTQ